MGAPTFARLGELPALLWAAKRRAVPGRGTCRAKESEDKSPRSVASTAAVEGLGADVERVVAPGMPVG